MVRWCATNGVAITTQGGNTGLVGGAVPRHVVRAPRREGWPLGPVDPDAGQITAGAGVTLAAVHAAAGGQRLGVRRRPRRPDTATIGGMVATNAGGIRVVRYGAMRAQRRRHRGRARPTARCRQHLAGLLKDNTGYDLAGLLCGSRRHTRDRDRGTAAAGAADRPNASSRSSAWSNVADAVALAGRLRRTVDRLEALEVMAGPGDRPWCAEHLGVRAPFADAGAVLLVEAAADHDPTDSAGRRASMATTPWRSPPTLLDGPACGDIRESQHGGHRPARVPHKLDVSVPLAGSTASFVDDVVARRGVDHGADLFVFGHIGDGNVHVN